MGVALDLFPETKEKTNIIPDTDNAQHSLTNMEFRVLDAFVEEATLQKLITSSGYIHYHVAFAAFDFYVSHKRMKKIVASLVRKSCLFGPHDEKYSVMAKGTSFVQLRKLYK